MRELAYLNQNFSSVIPRRRGSIMVDASPALLEQLADSVVVVVGVVDAARKVLADELAFAVR